MGVGVPGDGSSVPHREALSGSARIFSRREEKYEITRAAACWIESQIARRLPLFSYSDGHPRTFITTVYFDTRSHEFFHRAERDYEHNVKIRVREYYYRHAAPHPGMALHGVGENPGRELSPKNTLYITQDHCFVEVKQRDSGIVCKKRFAVPKTDLARLFRGDNVWPVLLESNPPSELGALQESYEALRRYLNRYPVEVTSIVNYRRTVYQHDERDLRVTLDDHLAVYPPVRDLYEGTAALTTEVLGKPIRRSDKVILEIKCPGDYPRWLREALGANSEKRLSKFTTSVRLLLASAGIDGGSRVDGAAARGVAGDRSAGNNGSGDAPESMTRRPPGSSPH